MSAGRYLLSLGFVALAAISPVCSLPHASASSTPQGSLVSGVNDTVWSSAFDYKAKDRRLDDLPICLPGEREATLELAALFGRQTGDDDYSCGPDRPCRNGACCPKATLYCNYGEEYCGTNGQSPNDVCWSNCDAKAECGKNADPPGKTCPLNVCCSEVSTYTLTTVRTGKYGFCGTTSEFCGDGCQSGCDEPSPGGSDSDIQKRVIGYYEAWAHDRSCQSMDFDQIPVGALTHMHFSFAYITPGDFNIAPMDDLDRDLFDKFTSVKRKNSGLKALVALGGWTFNDPGATQKVFSDMVSTAANRAKFIENLFSFMREYAFDGVDFDWEYPGADDRGGVAEDGANFVTFLKELSDYNKKQPSHYVVSFTAPTSYWYLRHFDLKAVDYVDWVNVMSYDLHGIWDSTNPIGNNVLAHTNLTEIKQAFDLFWRNKVKPEKLNLGFGFYGRSFQLSDPSCYKPGCKFKGGASPGGCSKNSGTLTYREIKQIVDSNDLEPYHLKEEAVKYITWNQDQWVSYDDEETFQQKVEWANGVGLGGMLIWAIDQDTDDLEALSGLLAPKSLKEFQKDGDNQAYWEEATVPDCYVTGCGGHCKAGFLKVTTQPCGSANWHGGATEDDSQLCCPIQGAPDPDDCTWRGGGSTPQSCNGHCHDDEVTLELNRWGDHSGFCFDGNKAYCCKSPLAQENKCYWAGVNSKCNGDDVPMTFSGTFLSSIVDVLDVILKVVGRAVPLARLAGEALVLVLEEVDMELNKYYCCPKDDAANWQNCDWYGDTESSDTCFDNHCPTSGHSVQLTDSPYGLGESCFPRMERTRVYCCDPTGGQPVFLPVPLENLFADPPTGDNVDTDFDLEIDDTWGTGVSKTHDDGSDPGDAAFNFVVLASPEDLQISLDKRDGSHWDILNCDETSLLSEEAQTVRMVCTDVSPGSNCHKIGLGHGVPGTILRMPPRCGPGKYAVAKSMLPTRNQTDLDRILPRRLHGLKPLKPVVYDLTFDYDFTRVPRSDSGDTQVRIDFSNQEDYWDTVVAAAASRRKTKRSLEHDAGGNHRRWLEDEFREDYHGLGSDALSLEELHRRWFGSDVLDWLSRMLSPTISREFRHEFKDEFTAKIVDEQWSCGSGDVQYDGYLLAQATTSVEVATSFGFTLTARLSGGKLDLTGSYLTFYNQGHVSATLKLEALASVRYTKQKTIVTLPFPGAALRVHGIATIGPAVRIDGKVDVGLTVSAEFETSIDIASWEIRQTLPDQNGDADPKTLDDPDYDDTGSWTGIQKPKVYAGVVAEGDATVHLIAAVDFGIRFDDAWGIGAAAASVNADGWAMVKMGAGVSTEATCPFTYGMTVGADLYATVEAPSQFGWEGLTFSLPSPKPKVLIEGGTCPDLQGGDPTRRRRELPAVPGNATSPASARGLDRPRQLARRSGPWGPAFRIPVQDLLCPDAGAGPSSGKDCALISGWDDDEGAQDKRRRRRGLDVHDASALSPVEKRTRTLPSAISFCPGAKMVYRGPRYDTSGTLQAACPGCLIYGYTNPAKPCNDYRFGQIGLAVGGTIEYQTEHVLEMQLLARFLDDVHNTMAGRGMTLPNPKTTGPNVGFCQAMKPYWYQVGVANRVTIPGTTETDDPIALVAAVWPGSENAFTNEFVLLEWGVNNCKGKMWGDDDIRTDDKFTGYMQNDPEKAVRNLKDCLTALRYMADPTISATLAAQKNRVSARLALLDQQLVPAMNKGPGWRGWQALGLANEWDNWMHDRAVAARTKVHTYVARWLAKLQENFASPVQRQNAQQGAAAGSEVAEETLEFIEKIDVLGNEWNAYLANPWNPPF